MRARRGADSHDLNGDSTPGETRVLFIGPARPAQSISVPTTAKSALKSMSTERLSVVRTDAS